MPVGLWRSLTAVETLLTFWPPWPPLLKASNSMSSGLRTTSDSGISGRTATVAVEVWILPCRSVVGTRWTR